MCACVCACAHDSWTHELALTQLLHKKFQLNTCHSRAHNNIRGDRRTAREKQMGESSSRGSANHLRVSVFILNQMCVFIMAKNEIWNLESVVVTKYDNRFQNGGGGEGGIVVRAVRLTALGC